MASETVVVDAGHFAVAAVAQISRRLRVALSERERVFLALAGGRTPRPVYRRLSTSAESPSASEWARVEFFWSDERLTPVGDPASNVAAARLDLLAPLGISEGRIHGPAVGMTPNRTAESYECAIRSRLGGAPGSTPGFDLVLLGLGSDGHTASLFPGALGEPGRLVVTTRSPEPPRPRVSFSFELLAAAREILFLVSGASKAEIVRRVIQEQDASLPATRVARSGGRVCWILDSDAASRLSGGF